MLTKTTLLLSIFIGVMLAVPASIWAVSQTATLAPGDTLTVNCGTRLTGSITTNQAASFACATPTLTPTRTSTPSTAATPTRTPVPAVDLARGRSISSVSSTASGSSATWAIDGNNATYWTSGVGSSSGNDQWVAVDLASATTVRRANVRWGPARGTSWWIESSNDNNTWTRVWPATGTANGDQSAAFNATARHFAVVARTGSDTARYQLASFELYATP